jgi:predicted Zn-ribbon and HTH transcriptional regulator
MVSFVCNDCGYRFESEKGKRCPYCASENVEKDKSAEDLVESVEIE